MNKVLCSTGTFIGTVNNFDYRLIEQYAGILDCDGLEMMVEPFWNDELGEIAGYLARRRLGFYSLHADKSIGDLISRNGEGDLAEALRRFELNCMAADKIGAGLLVLHLWGGTASDKNINFNIKVYGDLLEIARGYGVIITVENVVCNTHNALAHLCELHKIYAHDAKFIIDVRHAEFHKNLRETCEAGHLWANVLHTHISDYKGGRMDWAKLRPVLRPGAGDVDFTYFFGFLRRIKYGGWLALEAGARNADGVDFVKINESLGFIHRNLRG